jgi:hypothetical protein
LIQATKALWRKGLRRGGVPARPKSFGSKGLRRRNIFEENTKSRREILLTYSRLDDILCRFRVMDDKERKMFYISILLLTFVWVAGIMVTVTELKRR